MAFAESLNGNICSIKICYNKVNTEKRRQALNCLLFLCILLQTGSAADVHRDGIEKFELVLKSKIRKKSPKIFQNTF